MIPVRHYLRIDAETENALQALCKQTRSTKSELLRRYVQNGVKLHAIEYSDSIQQLDRAQTIMNRLDPAPAFSEGTETISHMPQIDDGSISFSKGGEVL